MKPPDQAIFRSGGIASLLAAIGLLVMLVAQGVSEELRVGTLVGNAVMAENGRTLPNALVVLTPLFDVTGHERQTRAIRTDAEGRFRLRNLVSGAYRVDAYTKAHALENSQVLIGEGQTHESRLALEPTKPYLDLYAPQHVFTRAEQPKLHVRGFAPEAEVEIGVYRVELAAIVRAGNLYSLLSPIAWNNPSRTDVDKSPDFALKSRQPWKIEKRDAEGIFDEQVEIPPLEEGIYWVRAKAGSFQRGTWLAVSRIALVTKSSPGRALAYVVDIETGAPVPGAEVAVANGATLEARGKTDADGLLDVGLPANEGRAAVVARSGTSVALCTFYDSRPEDGTTRLYVYTERPVYRPGDEVCFKGVARVLDGADYRLPPEGVAEIEVRDPANSVLLKASAQVDGMGTLDGSFRLPPDVVGDFELTVRYRGASTVRYVTAASYRKPDFRVTVTPVRPYFIRGDRVRMKVRCEYYFGGPVVGAKLTATVYRRPLWPSFDPDEEEDEYAEEPGWVGDYAGEVEAVVCDVNGEAWLEYDPEQGENPADEFSQANDSELTFQVSATESEQQYFDGSGTARLVRGEFGLRSEIDRYLCAPGETVTAAVAAQDHAGRPLAGLNLTFEATFEQWTGRRVEYVRDQLSPVRTDGAGRATFQFRPPAPGAYRIRASGRDRRGNRIDADSFVYVWRQGYAFGGPSPQVQLTLDRPAYRPGGSATLLIRAAKPGQTALVTVEGDRVLWRKVVPLGGASTTVEIPISREMAPNVYASVAFVSSKEFREASRRINVDLELRRLKVAVEPDRAVARPGEAVSYSITTETEGGAGVPADVSLAVVDEAIFAIREDRENPLAEFYPRRYQSVNTTYSFPELYLDGGEKGPANIEVRRDFRDTAFWNPSIRTGPDGTAQVRVRLPDNLTSWRATAVAFTADTRIGKSSANVQVRKDLMARLQTPTLAVVGDTIRVVGVVNNETGARRAIQVALTAVGVEVRGERTRSVEVDHGKSATLEWTIEPRAPGEGVLTLSARAVGFADAVEGRVPIRTHGRLETKGMAGSTRDQFQTVFVRKPGAVEGEVSISVAPSLATSILSALDELVDYPYGCTEQTMSRFMPAVVVARTLRDLGLRRPELESKIPEVVRRSLVRLRELQRGDGGFGWFASDDADPELTALVLEGLWRSRDAGQAVDPILLRRALDWANEYLAMPWPESDLRKARDQDAEWKRVARMRGRVAVAYAAALHGPSTRAKEQIGRLAGGDLDVESLAMVALAASRLGIDDSGALDRAIGQARADGDTVSWAGTWGNEASARMLEALTVLRPDDPMIPKVVRHLTSARAGNGWTSTRDTAQVLVGLSRYLATTRELAGSGILRMLVNGRPTLELAVSAGRLSEGESVRLPLASLREGENAIEFQVEGQAMLYYAIQSRQIAPEARLAEIVGPGLRVERTFHTLEARRIEDGSLRLMPSLRAEDRFRSGQPVRARIRLLAERDLQFVVVEAPTPSGMRVAESDGALAWSAWWTGVKVLDDRIALFVGSLPKGEHWLEYTLRAEAPGSCAALPVAAFQMYAPEIGASSAESSLRIDPR